jgi:hypothetical protein
MTADMTSSAAVEARPPDRRYRRLIEAHFAGRVSPAGEREMRAHLVGCADCRGYYDRHLRLALVDPGAALPAGERLARGLGLAPERPGGRGRRRWLALAAATATCAVALLTIGRVRAPADPQPRGGAAPGSQLLVYEVAKGQQARPVVAALRADSGLAFAYANIGHKQRLMVFAVDEGRRVYWYHPAWRSPAENPAAVAIARDDALHEIPQAIAHRFAGRRLQLYGVFLDRAMSVREMEALVARAPADDRGRIDLGVAGADVTRLDVNLVPAP